MTCHTELDNKMVYKLLRALFGKSSVFNVSLNVYIKERAYSAERHSCPVLLLDRCKVSKVGPLNSFFCVLCRLTDVISVHSRHLLCVLKECYLLEKLLS